MDGHLSSMTTENSAACSCAEPMLSRCLEVTSPNPHRLQALGQNYLLVGEAAEYRHNHAKPTSEALYRPLSQPPCGHCVVTLRPTSWLMPPSVCAKHIWCLFRETLGLGGWGDKLPTQSEVHPSLLTSCSGHLPFLFFFFFTGGRELTSRSWRGNHSLRSHCECC